MMRCLSLSLSLLVLFTSPARGDEPEFGTRFPLPGLDGRLLLVGGGPVGEDVRDAFGSEDAVRIEISGDRGVPSWTPEGGWASEHVLDASQVDLELVDAVESAAAIWIAAGDAETFAKDMPALAETLARHVANGGTVAIHGAGIRGVDALGLLPGFEIDVDAGDPTPGHARIEVPDGAAVSIEGRRARVSTARRPVVLRLAASTNRDVRTERFRDRAVLDLAALSRAAVARAGARFPADEPAPPTVEHGSLYVGGGGGLPREVVTGFIGDAGGADAKIVVIPTALGGSAARGGQRDASMLRRAGAGTVHVLHVETPNDAETEASLDLLRDATGLWFSGGRQWRLVDSYADTKAHELMHDVLRRGGSVCGSSAGASIQAEYMVRGHPLGNTVMMAEGYERGLGFISGVAVDQHFTQRNRFEDLIDVKRTFPQLLCIGIDEGTFAVIRGSTMTAVGGHAIHVYDGRGDDERQVSVVEAGRSYDLATRTLLDAEDDH